jgi:hypothetical protein
MTDPVSRMLKTVLVFCVSFGVTLSLVLILVSFLTTAEPQLIQPEIPAGTICV